MPSQPPSERLKELGIGGLLLLGIAYLFFQFAADLGLTSRAPVATQPSTEVNAQWAKRGAIIDDTPAAHKAIVSGQDEMARAIGNLGTAITVMNSSITRLEQDMRAHREREDFDGR